MIREEEIICAIEKAKVALMRTGMIRGQDYAGSTVFREGGEKGLIVQLATGILQANVLDETRRKLGRAP